MFEDKNVIIVEDSPTVRFEVKLLLKQIGLELTEAGGELGLFMQIEQYGKLADMVIMDLTLKEENGFDLIRKLKEDERYSRIPVVVLTEHADMQNVITAKKLGVDGYIRKPIVKDDFLNKVSDILINHELSK